MRIATLVRDRKTRWIAILSLAVLLCPGAARSEAGDEIFTLVIVPDTQKYCEAHPNIFHNQMEWIAKNAAGLNTRLVIHEGDVVETHDSEEEWKIADAAIRRIEGVVPYTICPGNHDMNTSTRDKTLYRKYFPLSRWQTQSTFGGSENTGSGDNHFHVFTVGTQNYLVLSLEYQPTDDTLRWANRTVREHRDHRVIVNTHSYMRRNERNTDGENIWEKFVRHHANINLVLCGHASIGRLASTGNHGNTVHQIMANYQGLDNGGNGWLRLMRFHPTENRIDVSTYSPLFNRYMREGDPKWSLLKENFFVLTTDLAAPREPGRPVVRPSTVAASYDPESAYNETEICEWRVLVHRDLVDDTPELHKKTISLLTTQLESILKVIPPAAVKELRRIPIWIERHHPRHPCMCYHPSADWLVANGMNPAKYGSVEIANPENFLTWCVNQPWMVLHELAHGYHFQYLGADNTAVTRAFEEAVKSGGYENVEHVSGKKRRHYAITNDKEYFAEATEAYFGRNDYFPFTREQFKAHDPKMHDLMDTLWQTHERLDD